MEEFESVNDDEKEVEALMSDYDIDRETAEQAQEFIVDGLDEEDAVELSENL